MRKTTGTPVKAHARLSRIALALAVLAGGLSCAWTVAQNTQAVAPAAAPAPATGSAPVPGAAAPVAPAAVAAPHANKSATRSAARKPESKLAWANLSAAQHQALEPLTGEWPRMSELQKEKWLEIGKRYTRMKPEEQQRLHERMREWVKLTPAQRSAARTNYARAKKLDAEEKHEQWAKYQQLSEEQKKKLAEAKLPRRVAKLPTTPAAAAPSIQLPAEALDRPLPVVPAPTPAAAPAPALVPGSQAVPVPALTPTAAAPTTIAVSAVNTAALPASTTAVAPPTNDGK
ncbi:DUF3106 domain-containing protein [Herbaspirillum sp.]|uniref:DUF3106 domain-containing protein n=1 Tax=Herbaspirillum sp. TaxID=1890675 RepID=UPI0031D5A158